MHAESGNTSPPDYIYLENGKSLRDVLNACRSVHSESLEMSILNAIGRSESATTAFCLNCKGDVETYIVLTLCISWWLCRLVDIGFVILLPYRVDSRRWGW